MILIPENESREFKYGVLKNGLKYTVVRDTNTTVSNIAVSIRAGAFNDPIKYMGLAHFLEHMLFMGSKKYKDEHFFMGKLSDLGGDSNAYTDFFETVYYLHVLSKNLAEILDIFSRFFIDPLFDVNSVSREINAVNSEHMKNLNSDLCFSVLGTYLQK
jgi:insulysin